MPSAVEGETGGDDMIVKYEDSLVVCSTRGGGFKVYVMGQADGHIMDWRGCNYKFVPVTGQPFRGFLNKCDADTYMRALRSKPERLREENERAKRMKGQYIPDERFEK